jgi:TPP-dependent pyruvate/acetoin dehydrogenase alpha subunit
VARAAAYGMPGVSVDGNDVVAVREAAAEATARARGGNGPTLLELKTWRHKGHFEGENPSYWDQDEQARWLAQDPILKFAARLMDAGMATRDELDQLDARVKARVDEAVDFAETSPDPAPEDALADVFA